MFEHLKKLFKEHAVITFTILVCLIVYGRFLFFGHISWDDPEMVFKNNYVKTFDLKNLFTNHFVGNYIPVTMFWHAVGWLFFGDANWGHHLLNILFHIINGVLVYQIGKRLLKNKSVAILGSLVFLLHPLQIESVGWISELKNVLSGTFYLAGMLSYLYYLESSSKKNYGLCLLFFLLGCLSKSSVVVLPLSLICLDIFTNRKLSIQYLWNKIPFLIFSIVFGIINVQSQTADLFINHAHEFPYYQRIGLSGVAILNYVLLYILPINLSVIYPYPEVKSSTLIVGFSVLIFLLGLVFFLFKKKKHDSAALILFVLVNLMLVLQFLPFGEVLYADRYFYIPIIGITWLVSTLLINTKINPNAIFTILLVYLSILSFARVNAWKSAMTVYEDIIKKYPSQFIALNSAGVESMLLNDDTKALEYLNRATVAAPRNYKGFYNRGLLFLKNNKPELAIKSFNDALALYPYAKAYTGRASAYHMLGDIPKAMNDANYAIRYDANNAKSYFVLGNCYNDLNKLDEAITEYNKSITLNKDDAEFYFKRAIVYGKKQDFNSCLNDLTVCLQLKPDYYEAYYWRGVAKINLKQKPCEDLAVAARHNYEAAINAYHKYCK